MVKIFTLKLKDELVKEGYILKGSEPSRKNPKYMVYLFERNLSILERIGAV
ncbi:MAG: hypothetical protein ACRDCE_04645 [Cetobacterium sp.]|uniref:hypothetical protein n=1 Tax=Cetobacterium sp. TaxID=2071632 RepID=UPI003EE4A0DA